MSRKVQKTLQQCHTGQKMLQLSGKSTDK